MKILNPIIPVSRPNCQASSWKNLLKTAINDPFKLLQKVSVDPQVLDFQLSEKSSFATRVPQPFIDKIEQGNPRDPLLLQVLASAQEDTAVTNYSNDPLQENQTQQPGLLHKYKGRLLLILASACAVNCRYCFRRHFPYQDKMASGTQLENALEYIASNQTISEVILSGGDPLMLGDESLKALSKRLAEIPHLKRLRIHTRLPIVIPQRITQELCEILGNTPLDCSMVLHINHANEIDRLLIDAVTQLRQAGVTILNQSVLLKGINDSVEVLNNLSESMFSAGILPYYLHILDKVSGAAHFDTPLETAKGLIAQMRHDLPGYLVPRLAIEEPGLAAKTIIA